MSSPGQPPASPGPVDRVALARELSRLRKHLPTVPGPELPASDALDAEDMAFLRSVGKERLSCIVVTLRHRVVGMPSEGPPSPGLAEAVLVEAVTLLQEATRASDLVLVRGLDSLVVLSPGAQPLEGRGLAARLEQLLHRRLVLRGTSVELTPRFGHVYRSPSSGGSWAIADLMAQALPVASPTTSPLRPPL